VSTWHARWQAGGAEALRSHGPSGPSPRVSCAQLATLEHALLQGATANVTAARGGRRPWRCVHRSPADPRAVS
jgi:hypothetical protein